jgi:hypothetical protein
MTAIEIHLRRIVHLASDWADFRQRVKSAYGAEYSSLAKQIAVEEMGNDWVTPPLEMGAAVRNDSKNAEREIGPPWTSNLVPLYGPKTLLVLKIIIFLIVAALSFPPFHLMLRGNMEVHLGFRFIGIASDGGNSGAVNVPLLACELLALSVIGCIAFLLARHWEQHGSI